MAPFEYLLLFAAVILGLSVSDLATSVHRIARAWRHVTWDWRPPLAAAVAFLKIVTQWWTWYRGETLARGLTFEMFLAVLVASLLLFLLAAVALPDEVKQDEGVDLRAYYERYSRQYWILFLAHWVVLNAAIAWAQMQIVGARFSWASPPYLLALAPISMLIVRNRWWHTLGLAGLIGIYGWQYFGRTLL